MKTNFSFGVNTASQLVRCLVDYTYVYRGEGILNMVFTCIFKIEEEAFDKMLQENKFVIEPFFSRYLATINVGAARGEIHARCEAAKNPLSVMTETTLPMLKLQSQLGNKNRRRFQ